MSKKMLIKTALIGAPLKTIGGLFAKKRPTAGSALGATGKMGLGQKNNTKAVATRGASALAAATLNKKSLPAPKISIKKYSPESQRGVRL